jgi:hypothetical protein
MMSQLGDTLREIAGQETDPPLWIYVTREQIPALLRAAAALDAAEGEKPSQSTVIDEKR